MIKDEIKKANNALLEVIHIETGDFSLPYSVVIEAISETEYQSYLTGWLMSKDLFSEKIDLSKRSNVNNI